MTSDHGFEMIGVTEMGRPTKLTPDIENAIVTALRAGNYAETAVAYAGIGLSTYYRWMERGQSEAEDDRAYREFREAIEKARAAAEVRDIALIDKAAANGSWQAAAWKLERRYPQRWGRVVRTEVTGADGGAVHVEVDVRDELRKVLGLDAPDLS
jgi:transposase